MSEQWVEELAATLGAAGLSRGLDERTEDGDKDELRERGRPCWAVLRRGLQACWWREPNATIVNATGHYGRW